MPFEKDFGEFNDADIRMGKPEHKLDDITKRLAELIAMKTQLTKSVAQDTFLFYMELQKAGFNDEQAFQIILARQGGKI